MVGVALSEINYSPTQNTICVRGFLLICIELSLPKWLHLCLITFPSFKSIKEGRVDVFTALDPVTSEDSPPTPNLGWTEYFKNVNFASSLSSRSRPRALIL